MGPQLRAEDLRVEVYRWGSVYQPWTRTLVTHLPTGIRVEDSAGTSEILQRERAMAELEARLARTLGA